MIAFCVLILGVIMGICLRYFIFTAVTACGTGNAGQQYYVKGQQTG